MTRRTLLSLLLFAIALPAFAFAAGGWAITTVEDLPEYFVVDKPTDVTFTVRQHGTSLASGLAPVVKVKSGLTSMTVPATAGEGPGEYVARITVPRAGDWKLTIKTPFTRPSFPLLPGPVLSEPELLPIRAIDARAPRPAPMPAADRGKALFVAKGCVDCHVHARAERPSAYAAAPELTTRTYPAAFLTKLLDDPPAARPGGFVRMPDLGLRPDEISALVAFINAPAKSP
jgi:hypothetical protein